MAAMLLHNHATPRGKRWTIPQMNKGWPTTVLCVCVCVYALVYLMNPVMLDDGVLSIWTWLIMQFSLFIPFSWVQYKYVLYMCVLVHY